MLSRNAPLCDGALIDNTKMAGRETALCGDDERDLSETSKLNFFDKNKKSVFVLGRRLTISYQRELV